jgi:methionyl-tRNA formyltransferase
MKILIYGSTYLSALTAEQLLEDNHHELVGYVPNRKRLTIPGKMPLPSVSEDTECDIILSLQYDQIIKNTDISFNVHPGLLPQYGGVDILYHTLKNMPHEQGITFHKITEKLDAGPIISKVTYPVLPNDTVLTLYERVAAIFPAFVLGALRLLEVLPWERASECYSEKPTIFKSSEVQQEDIEKYREVGEKLKKTFCPDF